METIYGESNKKNQSQGHSDFKSLISHNGTELRRKLLLTINRKSYMESPMTPSHLTFELPRKIKIKVTQILKIGNQKMLQSARDLIKADRTGSCMMHLHSVLDCLAIFA